MNREDFKGKSWGEIITTHTKILDKDEDFEREENEKGRLEELKQEVPKYFNFCQSGRYAALHDDYTVVAFLDEEPIALFYVYEVHALSINEKRGMLMVTGHETNHEYWFDDGEYSIEYTH